MNIQKSPAIIRITNLKLQTIIGCNDWERQKKQDIIINVKMEFDQHEALQNDKLDQTLDYRDIKKKIVNEITGSSFMLLEKLTDHILDIVMSNPKVLQATVQVDKPNALRYADSVSVEISAQKILNTVVVSMGSNINPDENIKKAIEILSIEQTVEKTSSLTVTKPIGFKSQPDFLNGCLLIKTSLSFEQFTSYLKEIENRLGRIKTENKNGPRTIDLDIVVWNNRIIDKDVYERDFLKKAIQEVLPKME